ncbi:MAG TPA: hypothetical protein VFE47_11230 [Tepidisphaeraceae bacterium]|jgi:Na+-translocating ferredoxin:NAD+ oxidoreductase RnfA subunit|nr:hypothetical protein [Tepidisphaeraceae bacterium]
MDEITVNPPPVSFTSPLPVQPLAYASPAGFNTPQKWHALGVFNPILAACCHILTLGFFTLFHFQLMHDQLPKNRPDDPSSGRAIGFMFIPFYNLYWMFFSQLRLLKRIDEQRRLAGLPNRSLRGLCIAMLVMLCIPYINFISFFIVHPVYICLLQTSVNELSGT